MTKYDITSTAKKHSICQNSAAPDFFQGALLGNGGFGVNVATRPDAVVLYLGHNNIWDIRIEEGHKDTLGTFNEIFEKIANATGDVHEEDWYKDYVKTVTASYHDFLYPQPYPASAIYLFYDRKKYELIEQVLDISNGMLTITFENLCKEKRFAQIFVSQSSDTIHCRTCDESGNEVPLFYHMKIVPHESKSGVPLYTVLPNGFRQLLPASTDTARVKEDKGFSVMYKTDASTSKDPLNCMLDDAKVFVIQVVEGLFGKVSTISSISSGSFEEEFAYACANWEKYWSCSGVMLEDEFLEHIWYTNTYFIKCVLSKDAQCPGLFGNWMYKDIATAWHGDYHMNYNTQQIFWGLMGANRLEQHLPYLSLVENLMPVSKSWAKEFYELDGVCFPHSAYPVPMAVMPYPSPDWGWEIFETPWTVQSLWWHYTYTKDKDLLKTRIYPLMREAAIFMVEYIFRDGANFAKDGLYHIFPTIVPELYGLTKNFDKNLDGIADLTLTKFLFKSVLQAICDLEIENEEKQLSENIKQILEKFPKYPTAAAKWGEVFISVQTEDPDNVIYNVPTNLMPVFPGEDIDPQFTSQEQLEIATRSWTYHYNEGGNDLVFYNLIGARLGILDLEKFKRQIRYCLLPNGTATDRATLTGGRYKYDSNLDFMAKMGIWIENFSLYAVINECLLRGHTDIIELFPNWDLQKATSFQSLRTKGAFLVDATCGDGSVSNVYIRSESSGVMQLKNPWEKAVDMNGQIYTDRLICVSMNVNDEISLYPQK